MIKEIDIAKPVEEFFEDLGFTVRSEVKGCDITAFRGEELIVIECKKMVNLKLIYQAVDRQEFCDSVYLAVPSGAVTRSNKRSLNKLLKRLELGLIFVHFMKNKTKVEVIFEPKENRRIKKHRKKINIIDEIKQRSGNYNVGGSVGKKLMTAYKENALEIALQLKEKGALSCKELKDLGTSVKTYSILYQNHYGWFFKDSGYGKYGLSDKGIIAVEDYIKLKRLN
ncbi:MAG: hypothetical protein JXR64_05665 [Spirochaetales bacterium]|nr:hypothetical protein [Spirochaetales bacterium]